jgi:hypothetical protein
MLEICRKRAMARNLMKMAKLFPQHFDFFPRTFILPTDREVTAGPGSWLRELCPGYLAALPAAPRRSAPLRLFLTQRSP